MIVVVLGLPGSGKSYFASRLATRLRAEYINSDIVRKSLGSSGRYSFRDKLAVYVEMVKRTDRFLDENKVVVVDATFHHQSMRELFLKEASKKSVRIYFIHVKANEVLIHDRLNKPRVDSEADFKVYQDIRDQFQELVLPHLDLESTSDNITSMLSEAVEYIKST